MICERACDFYSWRISDAYFSPSSFVASQRDRCCLFEIRYTGIED